MNKPSDAPQPWDLQAARNLYNIHRWGAKYFDINDAGRVVATPQQEAGAAVDVTDVIEEAKARGRPCRSNTPARSDSVPPSTPMT